VTVDPLDDLRSLRDHALGSLHGESLADQYERGAIEIAWADLTGEDRDPLLEDTLRVELRGQDRVDAYSVAAVSEGVQTAAARLARWQVHPEVDPGTKITKLDRRRARIIQDVQVGNVVFYRVEASRADGLDLPQQQTSAQNALQSLLEILPAAADDDAAVDGILGSEPALRMAVQDVSTAARVSREGLVLALQTPSSTVSSVLTNSRARALVDELGKPVEREYPAQYYGIMDGMRGTRHVFYLVLDDRSEIAGLASNELLPTVKEAIGRRVAVDVVVTQRTSTSGRAGKKAYRLVSVDEAPRLFDDE